MKCIRVGSRESKLAVIQAEIAIAAIRQGDPEAAVELVTMKTTGDKILDRTLDKVGGKGLFGAAGPSGGRHRPQRQGSAHGH